MSTITISALPEATSISNGTKIPVEISNITKNVTASNLRAYITSTVNANVTAANAAIASVGSDLITANTAMKSYVDAVTTAWTANAAAQANSLAGANAAIITANTAMKGYVDAVTTAWTANAATQDGAVQALQSNIGSFYTYANVHFGTSSYGDSDVANYLVAHPPAGTYSNATVASYLPTSSIITGINADVTGANATISALQANVGSFYTWANLNLSGGGGGAYGDANVATYLLSRSIDTYSNANVGSFLLRSSIIGGIASNIIALQSGITNAGNIVVSNTSRTIYVNSSAPTSVQGNIGDIWYQTF